MRCGDLTSDKDCVGISVVNYQIPILNGPEEILGSARRIARYAANLKQGYPGLDLVVFPEYSLQGSADSPETMRSMALSMDSEAVRIFQQCCVDNKIWGVFSLTGERHEEHPARAPYNTSLLIDDKGEIVQKYRKMMPWCPKEGWYPGDKIEIVQGPKGIKIGMLICDDSNYPEFWRECAMKGAELVVVSEGAMYPVRDVHRAMMISMAFCNNVYAAVANCSGFDNTYTYFGGSTIIGFDGRVVTELGSEVMGSTYAELSLSQIRNMRKSWRAENHLYKLTHRGYTATLEHGGGQGISHCPFDFYNTWVTNEERARKMAEGVTYTPD